MRWRSSILLQSLAWLVTFAAGLAFCLPGGAVLLESARQAAQIRLTVQLEAMLAFVLAAVVLAGVFSPRIVIRSAAWAVALMGHAALAIAISPGTGVAWQLGWLTVGAVTGAVLGVFLKPRAQNGDAVVHQGPEAAVLEPTARGRTSPSGWQVSRPILITWGAVACFLAVLLLRDGNRAAWQTRISEAVWRSQGSIILDDYGVPSLVFRWLERLPDNNSRKCLRCIDLGPDAGDEELEELAAMGLRDLPDLSDLRLKQSRVTDAGLAIVKPMARLECLALSPATTDGGLVYLRGLVALKSLDLGRTQITGKGLCHGSELPGLYMLSLRNTNIGDEELARLKQFAHLGCLDLSSTPITDAGLAHLKELPNLYTLLLTDTRISDAGVVHLKSVPRLQWLYLQSTKITDAGLRDLHAARPGMHVAR